MVRRQQQVCRCRSKKEELSFGGRIAEDLLKIFEQGVVPEINFKVYLSQGKGADTSKEVRRVLQNSMYEWVQK